MNLISPRLIVVFFSAVAFYIAGAKAEILVVHEWGVQVFDWSDTDGVKAAEVEFPDFVYTPKNRDSVVGLPAESGLGAAKKKSEQTLVPSVRYKPVLYFYGGNYNEDDVVDISMRFTYGSPITWWPQVNTYRNEKTAGDGSEIKNWLKDPKRDKNRPTDDRMHLEWTGLKLSRKLPEDLYIRSSDAEKDKLLSTVRDTKAKFVSNSEEVEKLLFYEGITHEKSAISVEGVFSSYEGLSDVLKITNQSKFPIYDVIAVYRDSNSLWTKSVAMLPAKNVIGDQRVFMRIPSLRFGHRVNQERFDLATKVRLIESLASAVEVSGVDSKVELYKEHTDAISHHLSLKEAAIIESIWHDEMFESEGLTIVYRVSPAVLNEVMPLKITSSHKVELSRCGLVINKNVAPPSVSIEDVNF